MKKLNKNVLSPKKEMTHIGRGYTVPANLAYLPSSVSSVVPPIPQMAPPAHHHPAFAEYHPQPVQPAHSLSMLSTIQAIPPTSRCFPTLTMVPSAAHASVLGSTTAGLQPIVQVPYHGRGPLPANFYSFTTAQPRYSVSMGSCSVQAIGSHLQNTTGRFVSCGSRDDRPVPRCT